MRWPKLDLNPPQRTLRQFAAAALVFFGGTALYQMLVRDRFALGCLLGALAVVGLVGILRPAVVRWLYVGLTLLMHPIGRVANLVFLALMFYVVLTPVAFVFRLRRRDVLRLRDNPNTASLWTERQGTPEPARYLQQF